MTKRKRTMRDLGIGVPAKCETHSHRLLLYVYKIKTSGSAPPSYLDVPLAWKPQKKMSFIIFL